MDQENSMTAEFNYTIPMLKKGFDMLELMTQYPEGVTMLELTQAMGVSKTTIYRLLGSLHQMG
ncbi:helix-turn-helix domain-containing protein, partial [Millionella massiliensis]